MLTRRVLMRCLLLAVAAGSGAALLPEIAEAGPARRAERRRVKRRVRRRVRRRHRRRVRARVIAGRNHWVVPVALAVGWELNHEDRVVVVHEVRVVEVEGTRTEIVVVQGADGKNEEIAVVREDDDSNGKEEQGTALAEGDETTPGIASEEEVEIEVEE